MSMSSINIFSLRTSVSGEITGSSSINLSSDGGIAKLSGLLSMIVKKVPLSDEGAAPLATRVTETDCGH